MGDFSNLPKNENLATFSDIKDAIEHIRREEVKLKKKKRKK